MTGFAAGKSDQVAEGDGIPQLRPTNILPDEGISLESTKYVPKAACKESDFIVPGEVLFNNTNSTAWVGKTALFNGGWEGPVVCSNHITRIRPGNQVSSQFLAAVLNMMQRAGYFGRLATNFNNQAGINSDTLADVVIPLADEKTRRQAIAALDAAHEQRRNMLTEAETLLSGINCFILAELDLTLPQFERRIAYAAQRADVWTRLDPDFHSPRFRVLRQRIERGKYRPRTIGDVCGFMQSGFAAGSEEQESDPEVGIPHIRPLNITGSAELHFEGTKMVPRASVGAEDIIRPGEILFNNTNSSMWVGKSVVFDAERECACSNHITRLRVLSQEGSPDFLAAVLNALRGLGYFALLSTNFNNQAGINVETLSAVQVPWPSANEQEMMAAEISDPSVVPRLNEILSKQPRLGVKPSKKGCEVAHHPEDFHLRLAIRNGNKALRDKLKALL